MSNFIVKAKDMFAEDSVKYKHFKTVFDTIRELAVSKTYYNADLTNIEEVLSILEMNNYLKGRRENRKFSRFISDVIKYCTPSMTVSDDLPSNWHDHFVRGHRYAVAYAHFVGTLLGVSILEETPIDDYGQRTRVFRVEKVSNRHCYSVVTLNYDLVIECLEGIFKEPKVVSQRGQPEIWNSDDLVRRNEPVKLAKLHGSAGDETIIAPTWNKGIAPQQVFKSWKLAFDVLSNANQIRILGYSLPESDNYIKYLLKAAVLQSQNLKRLDILCLDPNGSVKKRYDEFILYKEKRFLSQRIEPYLTKNRVANKGIDANNKRLSFDGLEKAHEEFFAEAQ